jgi:hypothetical protein
MNKGLQIGLIVTLIVIFIVFGIIVLNRYKLYKKCQEDSTNGYMQNGKPIKCKFSFNKQKIAYT